MNMGALVWGIGGGFILYFLTSNFLTILLKPSFEKPINSIEDMLERDMGLILWARNHYYIDAMRDSSVELYRKVSFVFKKSLDLVLSFQLSEYTVSDPDWSITIPRIEAS